LEAQARKLPVIASSHCGRVVAENVNGRVLPEVSSEAIAQCLQEILADPAALKSWSEASDVPQDCQMVRLVDSYLGIARELE
jgi:glycosyltransferase involved in cell wall biosynthesis